MDFFLYDKTLMANYNKELRALLNAIYFNKKENSLDRLQPGAKGMCREEAKHIL